MTSSGSAGKNFAAILTNIGTVISTQVLPFLLNIQHTLHDFSDTLSHNQGLLTTFRVAMAGIGGAVLAPIVAGFIAWSIAAGAAAIETIIATAPLLLIGAAIGLLVAGFILLYNNCAQFRAMQVPLSLFGISW
jgi:MFS family permease